MPDWKRTLRRRLGALSIDPARESEIIEELSQHLEDLYLEAREEGLDEAEAEQAVLSRLEDGSEIARGIRLANHRLAARAAGDSIGEIHGRFLSPTQGGAGLGGVWNDFKTSLRSLRRSPGFALTALVTLAVGIGTAAAVFSVVYGVLLRPLPYSQPERLAMIRIDAEGFESIAALSAPELRDLQEQMESFENVAGVWGSGAALTDGELPEQIRYGWVTSNLFPMLGIDPILGRPFRTEEDDPNNSNPVILLSEELWQRRYNSDPEIVGKTVELDDRARTVVGVIPAGFRMPKGGTRIELERYDAWVPQTFWTNRGQRWLRVFGRLTPEATFEQAQVELNTIADRLRAAYPEDTGAEFRLHLVPLHHDVVKESRTAMLALLIGVGLVLLISFVNVAGLLLSRFAARREEISVRRALGASRWAIVRKFLVENLLLTALGGLAGIVLAGWLLQLLISLGQSSLARLEDIRLDGPVLTACIAAIVLIGAVFGLASAWRGASVPAAGVLAAGRRSSAGPSGTTLRKLLVVAEVALSLTLLIGAGLMIRTFIQLKGIDPGFRSDRVVSFRVPIAFANFRRGTERWNFYRTLQAEIEQLPGVESSGGISMVPFAGGLLTGPFAWDPESEANWGGVGADYRTVTPGYFETLQAPIVAGRTFSPADGLGGRQIVIVDEKLAQQAWPGQNPVGRKLKLMLNPSGNEMVEGWAEVIGVVGHIRTNQMRQDGAPQLYRPFWMDNPTQLNFVVRTSADPDGLATPIIRLAQEMNSGRPVFQFRKLDDYLDEAVAAERFTLWLMSLFAVIAVLLAAVGLYGVISHSVARQTREIGVRMAMGAGPSSILGMVLRKGLALTAVGALLGTIGGYLLSQALAGLLFGVAPLDPLTYLTLAALLVAVSLAATLIPAQRAVRIDPVSALRAE